MTDDILRNRIQREKMAKRSIGSLMRKKLSDITNSQLQGQPKLPTQEENPLDTCSTDKDCIQQLLKERVTLMQLLAEKNKMIEWSGAELQMLRANVQKLQLQNWNLAQSNSHLLAELNLGRERIKALQHEILWRAALLKGKNTEVVGKVEMNNENNGSLSQPQIKEGEEKAGQPSPKASNHKQCNMNRRRCIRRRSTGFSTASTKTARKEKVEDKRSCFGRYSERLETQPLENLFEIEDAKYLAIQSRANLLSSRAVKDETGHSSALRNEAPRTSFGIPLRKSVEKTQSYKEINSSQSQSAKTRARRIN